MGCGCFLVACHMTRVIACFHGHGCQGETKYLIQVTCYKSFKTPGLHIPQTGSLTCHKCSLCCPVCQHIQSESGWQPLTVLNKHLAGASEIITLFCDVSKLDTAALCPHKLFNLAVQEATNTGWNSHSALYFDPSCRAMFTQD